MLNTKLLIKTKQAPPPVPRNTRKVATFPLHLLGQALKANTKFLFCIYPEVCELKMFSDENNENCTDSAELLLSQGVELDESTMNFPCRPLPVTAQARYSTPTMNRINQIFLALCHNAFKSEEFPSILTTQGAREAATKSFTSNNTCSQGSSSSHWMKRVL